METNNQISSGSPQSGWAAEEQKETSGGALLGSIIIIIILVIGAIYIIGKSHSGGNGIPAQDAISQTQGLP